MKQCPRCKQTYSDDQLNFCLEDGELLSAFAQEPPPARYRDDPPPTLLMNDPRATNPTNWPQTPPAGQPPARWQPQQNIQNQPFRSPGFVAGRDQTMPTIALILGILSIPLVCCYGGIWLGLPAAVLGFLGMRNADNDPSRYGGRGMAIGGMVLGVISFLSSLVWLFVIIAS
jgi:hypothetical protein